MAGTVIENLSNRKLIGILAALTVLQMAFFIVGEVFCPVPSTSMVFEMTVCNDLSKETSGKWFHIRPMQCDMVDGLEEMKPSGYDMRDMVFLAQMPHVRDHVQLKYSSWQQFLLSVIEVQIEHMDVPGAKLMMEVRLGYKDDEQDDWKELVYTNISRNLECVLNVDEEREKGTYSCDMIDLFNLPSLDHPLYLLNLRVPIDQTACQYDASSANCQLGRITRLSVIVSCFLVYASNSLFNQGINQTGGFTEVWLILKSIMMPVSLLAVCWYWNRVNHLARRPLLLEKAILALGISTVILNFPIEWLTIFARFPPIRFISDLRQGVFHAILFSFWLIFAGEHLIDDTSRNNINSYRFNLTFVGIAAVALLISDSLQQLMQIIDPFYSIYSSPTIFLITHYSHYICFVSIMVYFVFLFYKLFKVWTTIRRKRGAELYRNCENRRLKVEAVIFRFKFLIVFTLVCCVLSIVSYELKQQGESQLHFDDVDSGILRHSTSAFFTGTYGMWNICVMLLMSMYAPSHKKYAGVSELVDETEEMMDEGTESNPMTSFLKPSTD